MAESAINVITDGSCLQRPRRGGYAFLLVTVDDDGAPAVEEFSPAGFLGATNNEMELTACAEAVKLLAGRHSPLDVARYSKVVIYTDSTFVHDNFERAKYQWASNRWMRTSGPPVMHAERWKELIASMKRLRPPVAVEWIPGKSTDYTKRVDKLAKDSAKRARSPGPVVRSVRRKHSSNTVEAGSVGVQGQQIEIQIISAQHLPVQGVYRYKYEVMSEDSPYARKVDHIFSERALRHRYIYEVRLNNDPGYPQIAEVIGEVGPAERTAPSAHQSN